MKKLSLKALGATILAAGLVLAGVALPANAVPAAGTISVDSFTAGTGTPGFTYTTGTTASGWTTIAFTAEFGNSPQGFQPKTGCSGSGLSFASCGITSIQVDTTTYTSASGVSLSAISNSNSYVPHMTFTFPSAQAGGVVTVTWASGAWVPPQINGTYPFLATTNNSGGTYSDDVTVTGAQSTVMFTRNVPMDFSFVIQSASVPTALTANTFTRDGYSFAGWATSPTGPVVYANGATYAFFGPTQYNQTDSMKQLYAVWTQGSSPASASLTLGASTGQLVAGSTVAIVASGLQTSAPYSVVVQSTPQTLSPAGATATAGAVNSTVTLPAGLEAGWHTLTFSSTAADGSAISSVTYFKVSSDGTLLATASTIPAELASTGIDAKPYLYGGLTLAILGSALLLIARRKQTN